jgi:hypothetical protein
MSGAWVRVLSMIACFLALQTGALGGSAPKTVVVVTAPGVQPLARRLGQEIESLGLAVKWISPEGANPTSLEHEALAAGAVASIRIAPTGSGDVELAIFDGSTGKTASWKIAAATGYDPASGEITATRTIELLRASLLEMAARRASIVEPTPAPEVRPVARSVRVEPSVEEPSPTTLSLDAGPSLLYSAHWQPGVHMLTALTWMPVYRAGITTSVMVPITPARFASQEGTVDLFATFYRLGAVLEVTRPRSPVSLHLTAAAGLGRLHLIGEGVPPYSGATEDQMVVTPSVGITARIFLAPNLGLFANTMGSAAFPKTVVRLAGREASTWGRPAIAGAIGLELSWDTSEAHRSEIMSVRQAGRR